MAAETSPPETPRSLKWVASSLKDLQSFPKDVQRKIGFAIRIAQDGKKSGDAKPLTGFGSGVYEIVCDFNTDTFRAVYLVEFAAAVYVLDCFQKKSKSGIKTPTPDKRRLNSRIAAARQHHEESK